MQISGSLNHTQPLSVAKVNAAMTVISLRSPGFPGTHNPPAPTSGVQGMPPCLAAALPSFGIKISMVFKGLADALRVLGKADPRGSSSYWSLPSALLEAQNQSQFELFSMSP